MTFQELIQGFIKANGFPTVKDASGAEGIVTLIKSNPDWKGCAVRYPNMDYDTWYYAEPGTDKRRHYIDELTIIDPKPEIHGTGN
jgi:hypothetical protein